MISMYLIKALLALMCAVSTMAQEIKVEQYPMDIEAEQPCSAIIATHAFNGDCCTVKDTNDGGCVLIVTNGKCSVEGDIWYLDYTSTYTLDGCPTSQYDNLPTELADKDEDPDQADKDIGDIDSSAQSVLALFGLLIPAAIAAVM
eukprot:scaffold8150_cov118-Cylindrotheca_fusiformis.AAC.12